MKGAGRKVQTSLELLSRLEGYGRAGSIGKTRLWKGWTQVGKTVKKTGSREVISRPRPSTRCGRRSDGRKNDRKRSQA